MTILYVAQKMSIELKVMLVYTIVYSIVNIAPSYVYSIVNIAPSYVYSIVNIASSYFSF